MCDGVRKLSSLCYERSMTKTKLKRLGLKLLSHSYWGRHKPKCLAAMFILSCCLHCCLFVCLSAALHQNYWTHFPDTWWRGGAVTREGKKINSLEWSWRKRHFLDFLFIYCLFTPSFNLSFSSFFHIARLYFSTFSVMFHKIMHGSTYLEGWYLWI